MNANMNANLTLGALLCLSAFALPAAAWDFHSHRHVALTSDSRLNREICRDRHRIAQNSRQAKDGEGVNLQRNRQVKQGSR